MDRMDMLDMSVFAHGDGIAWAKQMLDAEMKASLGEYDFLEYPLLSIITENPDRLRTHTVPRGGMRLPMGDAFMDVMSRAPESTMERYRMLRAMARRFGPGANDWLHRRALSFSGFERRAEGAPKEAGEIRLPLPEGGDRRLTIFNIDENLAPNVFDFIVDMTGNRKEGDLIHDILFFNLDSGFAAAVAPGISLLSTEADHVSVLLNRIFWGGVHIAPQMALTHSVGENRVRAILPRNLAGYSMYEYLEPFLYAVSVQRERVLVDFDAVKRPESEHLFYQYSSGAHRRGAKSPDGVYWRVEIPVDSTFGESDVFGNIAGVVRAHAGSADIYIEGSLGTAQMEGWSDVGSAMGFDPWVLDLVATGPAAQIALTNAISALSSIAPALI